MALRLFNHPSGSERQNLKHFCNMKEKRRRGFTLKKKGASRLEFQPLSISRPQTTPAQQTSHRRTVKEEVVASCQAGMSLSESAKNFGVAHSTLHDRLKSRSSWQGYPPAFSDNIENVLENYCLTMSEVGLEISRDEFVEGCVNLARYDSS